MHFIHAGLRYNSIPETPAPRTASKTSPFIPSPCQDQNTSGLNGSAIDPITLTDSDSSDDGEPEVVPLRNRIGVASNMTSLIPSQAAGSTASLTPSNAAGSSTASLTPSHAGGSLASLTPSQVAGAAAIRRLSALESKTKYTGQPLITNLDSGINTNGEKNASVHQRVRQAAVNKSIRVGRESLQQSSSTSAGASSSSRSLSRSQTSHQSTTEEQSVDLSTPEFILRPGIAIQILHSVCHCSILAGEFEVVLCVDNSESTANRKYGV